MSPLSDVVSLSRMRCSDSPVNRKMNSPTAWRLLDLGTCPPSSLPCKSCGDIGKTEIADREQRWSVSSTKRAGMAEIRRRKYFGSTAPSLKQEARGSLRVFGALSTVPYSIPFHENRHSALAATALGIAEAHHRKVPLHSCLLHSNEQCAPVSTSVYATILAPPASSGGTRAAIAIMMMAKARASTRRAGFHFSGNVSRKGGTDT